MLLDVYGHYMPTETGGYADALTAPDDDSPAEACVRDLMEVLSEMALADPESECGFPDAQRQPVLQPARDGRGWGRAGGRKTSVRPDPTHRYARIRAQEEFTMTHPQPIVPGPVSDFLASVALAPRQAYKALTLRPLVQTELGKLSANRYAPDSSANAYRAGSPFRADSRSNPYGTGWPSVGE
ncbi:MAG: hypothetical protein JRS35_07175 [Deltaproteobacteria bacterium]|nr:hypothetical protein [Deltaproteobacteria bacterium]